jgi:hypothetical protein
MFPKLRHVCGELLGGWVAFWRRVEGRELEPPIWRNDYLSKYVAVPRLCELGREQSGFVIDVGAGTSHGAVYLGPGRSELFATDTPVYLLSSHYLVAKFLAVFFPLIFVAQALIDLFALLFHRLDGSGAFPLAIAVLARKPDVEAPCAG